MRAGSQNDDDLAVIAKKKSEMIFLMAKRTRNESQITEEYK
jgi:hypothetical protein